MEPREMTEEYMGQLLARIEDEVSADGARRLVEHISALKARAERAEKALAGARDAALEEAADVAMGSDGPTWVAMAIAAGIRALKSQPARRFVDAEKVREVLRQCGHTGLLALRELGLEP